MKIKLAGVLVLGLLTVGVVQAEVIEGYLGETQSYRMQRGSLE